jgi:biotin transporter BioY
MMFGLGLGKALAVGMYPFIPGDIVKIAAAYAIVKGVRPLLHSGRRPDHGRSQAEPAE